MTVKRLVNVLTLVLTLAVNYLANALPIAGITTGQVSDSIPSRFVPAGYAFSIWGIIYLALMAMVGYTTFGGQKSERALERIGWWFAVSNVLNALWLVSWHSRVFWLSQILMFGILASLLVIYQRLEIGMGRATRAERGWVHIPFSIYIGWISVASIANFAATLISLGFGGVGPGDELWSAAMLVVGTVLALLMIRIRHEIAFPLVVVWAFVAIAAKWMAFPTISITALVGSAVVAVVLVVSLLNRRGAGGRIARA